MLIISIQWITQLVFLIITCWIETYSGDKAVQRLKNQGQVYFRLFLVLQLVVLGSVLGIIG